MSVLYMSKLTLKDIIEMETIETKDYNKGCYYFDIALEDNNTLFTSIFGFDYYSGLQEYEDDFNPNIKILIKFSDVYDLGEGHDFVAVISYNETNVAIVSQRYDTKDSYIIDPKFKDMLEYLAENCLYKVDFNDYLYDTNCDFQY